MDCLRITGGLRLEGSVRASGSKNASLPIMAASILTDGPVSLAGVPDLVDVDTLSHLLRRLGIDVTRAFDGTLKLLTVDAAPTLAPYELVRRMRASFCVLGPLVAKRRRAVVSLPGGCNIGTRPVDLHLAGLAALGAEIRIEHGYVIAFARRLHGARIDLAGPHGSTVTGTANLLSAAVLARGRTVITSAAVEPEIVDLGRFLIAMGAKIEGLGTRVIEIEGVEGLDGTSHRVIPDRIESGTLLLAAAATRGHASIHGADASHMTSVLEALTSAGADLSIESDSVSLSMPCRARPILIDARPYPGVPTDLQAQLMALASVAGGTSKVTDWVFPDRFRHVDELSRLGARMARHGASVTIDGVARLSGAIVTASDLRASAALVLAGLMAKGETLVRRANHLDRGYEGLDQKLAQLGARLSRIARREDESARGGSPYSHSLLRRPITN